MATETQRMRDDEATWDLARFRAAYAEDDNNWWAIGCGHHQNLFEAACDALDDSRAVVIAEVVEELTRAEQMQAAGFVARLAENTQR